MAKETFTSYPYRGGICNRSADGGRERRNEAGRVIMEKKIHLFITEQGATLRMEGRRLVVMKGSDRLCEIPLLHLRHLIIFGNSTLTPPAISRLLKEGVFVSFLTKLGKFSGALIPAFHSDGFIRKIQIIRSEEPSFRLSIAKEIVDAKIDNSLWFLKTRRGQRRRETKENIIELERIKRELESATALNEIRGIEGLSSKVYFSALQSIILKGFNFIGRKKHPATDPVNALLSLSYSLLYSICFSFLHINGLDPFIGFYHEIKRGHASLASDIMEEFRVPYCDALVFRLVNQGYFSEESFTYTDEGVFLVKDSLKIFLREFAASLDQKVITEDGFKISKWHLIQHQVKKLKKAVTGKGIYKAYRAGAKE